MALRTVGVRLTADVLDYQRKLRAAGQSTKDFVGEMDKAAQAGRLDTVADSVGMVGLGLVGMAGYAVKSAMDFEKSMSAVSAATHGSAAEMDQLREAALQAGKDTQYSATGAADAITELSKAGIATADVLNGGLDGALDLAAAGQLDVAEAAETAASAMTQFKLSGKDVPHIADLLAAAAGKAQGTVHDMGMALNQTGLIAAQTGLTIEETTGGLAAFANAGLIGSDAGTSFKQMLLMLQAPSEKSKNLMDELGITLYDSQGKFVGLTKFADRLRQGLKDLTPEARAAAMAQIFGADATRAASIVYEQGAEGIQQWIDKVDEAGYAQKTAAELTDNLAGDIERLKGEIETLAIEAGSGANGGLRVLVQALEGVVGAFASMPSVMQSSLTIMAGIGGVAALAAAGWVKSRRASADFRAELEAMGPAGERAAVGLQKAQKAAALAAVAFVGLEVAGAVFDKLGNAAVNVDRLTASLQEYAKTGKMTEGLTDSFGKNLDEFGLIAQSANAATHGFWGTLNDLGSTVPGVSSVIDSMNESLYGTSFNDATERMKALDESFSAFISTQKDAEAAGKLWNEMISKSGLGMNELAALLPASWKGLQDLQAAAHGAADGQKELADGTKGAVKEQEEFKTATDAAAAAANGQREALSQLADMMKAEANPVFGLIKAQKELAEAKTKATAATRKYGASSKEAKAATEDLVMAAIGLQGSVGALGSTFDGKLSPALRQTLKAAGLTDKQIRTVEASFKDAKKAAEGYDGKYAADTSAPGAPKAKKDIDAATAAANKFAGPWKAEIGVTGYAAAKDRLLDLMSAQYKLAHPNASAGDVAEDRREKARFMATGGPVTGPGTGTSDSIAAYLSNGEHVWTADEVARLGGQQAMLGLREAVRSGKRVEFGDETPGFAAGGPVTRMPFNTSAAGTYVMPRAQALALIVPPIPSGGMSYKAMQAAIKGAFPGLDLISGFRPGARTLSGNRSYHSLGRAVDYPPSKPLAEWVNANYFARTKELITPWNDLNIHNGRRHRYTGAVWNQHNFAGGNAHDHWAMARGGTINEPIFGFGASGRTYSFGENYMPERVTPNWQGGGGGAGVMINVNVATAVGVNPVDQGRQVAAALKPYLASGGVIEIRGTTVLAAP